MPKGNTYRRVISGVKSNSPWGSDVRSLESKSLNSSNQASGIGFMAFHSGLEDIKVPIRFPKSVVKRMKKWPIE